MNFIRIIVAAGFALWGIMFYGVAGARTRTLPAKTAPAAPSGADGL